MIVKLQSGNKLKIEPDEKREARRKYKEHSQLSISQKLKRNLNIASNFLKSGPNITNFGNAVSALFGGYSPENPDVTKGDPPATGIKNFENLVRTARVAREFNNVINNGLVRPVTQVASKIKQIANNTKQSRLISPGTYPLYRGPQFDINEIVNPDGTVNPRKAMQAQHTVAKQFGNGAHKMEHRLENPEWHKEDPNTYEHTKRVAQSAWRIPTPEGYTKQDQMIAALGHDFGKIVSGDGHAQIGADLAKQVFIGIKPHQLQAIREHMGQPTTQLGEVTKAADILNGRDFNYLQQVSPELYNKVFIKPKAGQAVNGPVNIFQKPVESNDSKPNVYVLDNFKWKELTYPSYINHVWNKLKAKGVKTDPYDRNNTNEQTRMNFFNKGFNPVFKLYPQQNLKAHAQEILRRMRNFGLDVDNTMGELPLYGKKSIRDLVTLNSGRTSYVGYYNNPGVLGTYFHNNGTSIIDPGFPQDDVSPLRSIATTMHHERNMHGTQKFLTPEMWKLYEDFLKKIFTKTTTDEFGRTIAITTDNSTIPIGKGSLKKEELRATIGEMVKNIYDNQAHYIATTKNPNIKKYELETIRPYFEQVVDEMPDERLNHMLSTANGYGVDYAEIGPKENPNFYKELRNLLKVAPATLPFLIPRKEEKK